MTGRPIVVHQPNADHGLGIRSIKKSPNDKMLACAMFDTHITLYNNLSQSKICDLDHTDRVQIEADKKKGTVVFEEKLSRE